MNTCIKVSKNFFACAIKNLYAKTRNIKKNRPLIEVVNIDSNFLFEKVKQNSYTMLIGFAKWEETLQYAYRVLMSLLFIGFNHSKHSRPMSRISRKVSFLFTFFLPWFNCDALITTTMMMTSKMTRIIRLPIVLACNENKQSGSRKVRASPRTFSSEFCY